MPIYYRNKKTGTIEAKYVGCDTQSIVFRNEKVYERFEVAEDFALGTIVSIEQDENGKIKVKSK